MHFNVCHALSPRIDEAMSQNGKHCFICFKGGESSSQFQWFTIAKIEL